MAIDASQRVGDHGAPVGADQIATARRVVNGDMMAREDRAPAAKSC
jgi:hypothetical protein